MSCIIKKDQSAIRYGSHYVFDYPHYSFSTHIDSLRFFITNYVYNRFKSQFVSTYEKFVASLQGKGNLPITNQKEGSIIGSEIVRIPSITFDPSGVESDDLVSPFFWNYFSFNPVFESIVSKGIKVEDKLLIYPQFTYLRLNVDIHAVFNSPYEKLDFDMRMIQAFKGFNRLGELYRVKAYIPLPKLLLEDFSDINWVNSLPGIIVDVVRQTGETLPFFTWEVVPKVQLSTIGDVSNKYGGPDLPEFKSSFNITTEGRFITSLFVVPLFIIDNMVASVSFGTEYKTMFSMILSIISSLLKRLQFDFTDEELCNFVFELIERQSKSLLEILRCIRDRSFEVCEVISELISIFFRRFVPSWLICEIINNDSVPDYVNTGSLFTIDMHYKCSGEEEFYDRAMNVLVEEDILDTNRYMTISRNIWKYDRKPLIVLNSVGNYEITNEEVKIYGPLFKGQVISIIF